MSAISNKNIPFYLTRCTLSVLNQGLHFDSQTDVKREEIVLHPKVSVIATALARHHHDLDVGRQQCHVNRGLQLQAEYEIALRSAQHLLSSPRSHGSLSALACLLLAVLESLRDQTEDIRTHLCTGMKILTNVSNLDTKEYRPLVRTYINFAVSTLLQRVYPVDFDMLNAVQDLVQRHTCFEGSLIGPASLFNDAVALFTNTYYLAVKITVNGFRNLQEQESMRRDCLEKLSSLRATSDLMLNSVAISLPNQSFPLILNKILRARLELCYVVLKCCATRYQTTYDRCYESFRKIVSLLTEVLQHQSKSNFAGLLASQVFAPALGVISTIHTTVSQCRDARLRRSALHLLELCPRRDGPWNAAESSKICHRLIEFEERAVDGFAGDRCCTLIPEESRVHFHNIVPTFGVTSGRMLCLYTRPRGGGSGYEISYLPLGKYEVE